MLLLHWNHVEGRDMWIYTIYMHKVSIGVKSNLKCPFKPKGWLLYITYIQELGTHGQHKMNGSCTSLILGVFFLFSIFNTAKGSCCKLELRPSKLDFKHCYKLEAKLYLLVQSAVHQCCKSIADNGLIGAARCKLALDTCC